MTKEMLCLGECMVELVEKPDGTLTRGMGGDTFNTALYLARLGVPTGYVTALGDDPFSTEMLASWKQEGIDTRFVALVPGRVPGLYLIRTDDSGERSFFYWRDSAPVRQLFDLPQTEAIVAALAGAGVIYLSGITLSLFGAADRDRLFGALVKARSAGAKVAFDSNFRPRGWPDRAVARSVFVRIFAMSDIVFVSVEDYAQLFGVDDPEAIIGAIRQAGVPEAVVKLPSPSCVLVTAQAAETVEAEPVANVVDTTAAGDSFAAAYLAVRCGRDGSAREAALAGHRLAGTVVQHRGAIIPMAAMPAEL